MTIRVLITAVFAAASTNASALSAVSPPRGWSNLTSERLQQLPSSVRAAILNAQKLCGEDSPGIRTGFIRYLKDASGTEFVALHFDQFRCANRAVLCSSNGCRSLAPKSTTSYR